MNKYLNNRSINNNCRGIVLLVTLVILVVLAMLGYTLSSRVLAFRLRNQYLIDYTKARYSCDSAIKYTLVTMEEIEPQLINRWDMPDFSDLFSLDSAEYEELLEIWKLESQVREIENNDFLSNIFNSNDVNDANDTVVQEYENISIPGPYGAPWPLITEPAEFEIGSAKVRIEIEDENAKYPLGWGILKDTEFQREIDAGFETFCEMSGLNWEQIDLLKEDIFEIKKLTNFKMYFEPVVTTTKEPVKTTSRSSSKNKSNPPIRRTILTVATQITNQTAGLAKFFNSTLLDKEILARPTIVDDNRKESPLKYISTWGTRVVNINTAPRHVLEAALIFGGNQVEIADQIIQERKFEPFQNIEDLQERITGYTESLEKCHTYITTTSRFFTIRITAVSGLAKASCVIAITKDGSNIKQIAVING